MNILVARARTDGHVTRAGSRTASLKVTRVSAATLQEFCKQQPCHTTAHCFRGRYGLSSPGTRVPATSLHRSNGICQRSTIPQPNDLRACSKLVTSLLPRSRAYTSTASIHTASPRTETTVRSSCRPFRLFPGQGMFCCCVPWFRSRSGAFVCMSSAPKPAASTFPCKEKPVPTSQSTDLDFSACSWSTEEAGTGQQAASPSLQGEAL